MLWRVLRPEASGNPPQFELIRLDIDKLACSNAIANSWIVCRFSPIASGTELALAIFAKPA